MTKEARLEHSASRPTLVSLTFDDALDEHLDLAAPALERHGFRGTFFLPIRTATVTGRAEEWKALAERGHELGNHTVFHPGFAARPWVRPGNAIEDYDLDRMDQELELANRVLTLLDGRAERTFAYPCNNSVVGAPGLAKRALRTLRLERTPLMRWLSHHRQFDLGSTEQDYSTLLPRRFVAARSGPLDATADMPFPPDRYAVPCLAAHGAAGEALLDAVGAALQRRRWTVLMFHGLGSAHNLNCEVEDFSTLLQFLADSSDLAVLPFGDAARAVWGED